MQSKSYLEEFFGGGAEKANADILIRGVNEISQSIQKAIDSRSQKDLPLIVSTLEILAENYRLIIGENGCKLADKLKGYFGTAIFDIGEIKRQAGLSGGRAQ